MSEPEPSSSSNMDAKDGVEQAEEQDAEEPTITLSDFLEEERKLENMATALLGHLDDTKCTYSLGYLDRQALYACKTCSSGDSEPAGFCLACSYHCHEGHDLLELYTKRFFRCDCGNSKFSGRKCNLEPEKASLNEKNLYNQNFKGVYCVCSRPYPDPDAKAEQDCMLQCIICEDWYHSKHLNCDYVPSDEAYGEMICGPCTDKLPFLKYYLGFSITKNEEKGDKPKEEGSTESVNVEDNDKAKEQVETVVPVTNGHLDTLVRSTDLPPELSVAEESRSKDLDEAGPKIERNNCDDNEKPPSVPDPRSDETRSDSSKIRDPNEKIETNAQGSDDTSLAFNDAENKPSEKSKECLLKTYKKIESDCKGSATFWPDNFRSILCTCPACEEMYRNLRVSWLTDDKDTCQAYQEKGVKANEGASGESAGGEDASLAPTAQAMKAISHLDRFTQVEVIQNYISFESELIDYLKTFARNKRVVTERDIHDFFDDMKARKRQKLDGPPFHCR